MKKLTPEFIDTKNLLEHQWKLIDKFEIFQRKINKKSDTIDDVVEIFHYYEWYSMRFEVWVKYNNLNKSDTFDDVVEIFDYYEWYSMRFEVWVKYNNLNKPKKWSKEKLLLYINEKIIRPRLAKFINYLDYKYGDMCEFCGDYECFLSSCICCAKFGCMKCVECYTDKNFGSCYNCNIKE